MAEFKWYLNRQGVRGAKGDKGEKGFSPVITEKENTKESYVLHIQNETDDTSFDTPNLKEGLVPEDLGGDYVKLNRDTGRQYYGNIDEGTNTIKGVVRFATDIEASNGEEVAAAVTPDQVAGHYATKATTDKLSADLTALTTQEQNDVITLSKRITTNETNISSMKADISTMKTSLGMKQTKLTAGTNITLTDLSDGTVKIDAAGGGGGTGDVTAAGDNVFTGSNTFNKTIKLGEEQGVDFGTYFAQIRDIQYFRQHTFPAGNDGDYVSHNLELNASGGGDIILNPSDVTIQDGMTGSSVTLKGKVCDLNRKAYIKQDTVEAGDNITVTQTELGVKISAITPTIAVIDGGNSLAN